MVFVVTRTRVADTGANPQLAQQLKASLLQRAASGDVAAYVNEARRKSQDPPGPRGNR